MQLLIIETLLNGEMTGKIVEKDFGIIKDC
jgi:hypothetical protein